MRQQAGQPAHEELLLKATAKGKGKPAGIAAAGAELLRQRKGGEAPGARDAERGFWWEEAVAATRGEIGGRTEEEERALT